MKKTLTANISGTVFHIEEDAYDRLNRYLGAIRAQFTGSVGQDEIMADIEARIAELFTERLGTQQVVTVLDVDHVISVMGQPEQYAEEGSTDQAPPTGPSAQASTGGRRRLFRDPEDQWVGGVFGGLAAYLNTDPLWMRIAFILLLIFGVGSPLVIYLILWALIPVAETAAERLMMQGEPVNVDNLKRAFEEGAEKVKQGADRFAKEADSLGRKWSGPSAQRQRNDVANGLERFFRTLMSVASKVIGALLLVLGAAVSLGLITALIGGGTLTYDSITGMDGTGIFELSSAVFESAAQGFWFTLASILLALVPAIGLFLGGLRLLTDLRAPAWMAWSLTSVWIVALGLVIIIGVRLVNDFKRVEPIREEVALAQPKGQTLFLDAMALDDRNDWSFSYSQGKMDWDMDGFIQSDSIHLAFAELDVVQSPDSLYHLTVERKARARTSKGSLVRAGNVTYHYEQSDSLMRFSPWLGFDRNDKIRAQAVRFVIEVPVGKAVHFGERIGFMLDDVDNVTNTLDSKMVGRTWTMTAAGLSDSVRPEDVPDSLRPPAPRAQPQPEPNAAPDAEAGTISQALPPQLPAIPDLLGQLLLH